LESLTKYNRKIHLKQLIDWDNDGVFETDIKDDILSATIDIQSSGNLNTAILDKATITTNNTNRNYSPKNYNSAWQGNVIPFRMSKIFAGDQNEEVEIFSGNIKGINPNYNNNQVSINLGDTLEILKREDAPEKFYIEEYKEDIIKEWLDTLNLNYTEESIDQTGEKINYSFEGMTYFDAIQLIAESCWAKFYFSNGNFYFRVDKNREGINEVAYTLSTYEDKENGIIENIDKISEEYNNDEIYNEVEIVSEPLTIQPRQVVWSGIERESKVNTIKQYSDINSKILKVADKNRVPLNENSLVITDKNGEVYSLVNKKISKLYYNSNGCYINFKEDYFVGEGDLNVSYTYYTLKLRPFSKKEYIVEFEVPMVEPKVPLLKAKNLDYDLDIRRDQKDFSASITKEEKENFDEYTVDLSLGARAEISLNLNLTPNVYSYVENSSFYVDDYNYIQQNYITYDIEIDGKRSSLDSQLKQRILAENEYTTYGWESNADSSISISKNITLSSGEVKLIIKNHKFLQSKMISDNVYFSTILRGLSDISFQKAEYITEEYAHNDYPLGHSEFNNLPNTNWWFIKTDDMFQTELELFENRKKARLTLINNSEYNLSVYSDNNPNNIYLTGQPIKNTQKFKSVKKDQDSIDSFGAKKKLTVKNNLLLREDELVKLRDYLINQYSTPYSNLKVETKGIPHLEIGDTVYINQKDRQADNTFLIKGMRYKFQDGSWKVEFNLRQETASNWQYSGDKAEISFKPQKGTTEYVYEQTPEVENLKAYENSYVDNRGQLRINIDLSYIIPRDNNITSIFIYMKENNGEYKKITETINSEYTVKDLDINNKYQFKVYTHSNIEYVPDFSNGIESEEIITKGRDLPPSPPSDFQVAQRGREVVFSWTKPDNQDIKAYEIRQGDTWEYGELFGENITITEFSKEISLNGKKTYMIKSIDNGNNYSEIPIYTNINITNVEREYNILVDEDETEIGDGIKQNIFHLVNTERSALIMPHCLTFNDLKDKSFQTITSFDSFPNFTDYAVYETQPIDTLKSEAFRLQVDYVTSVKNNLEEIDISDSDYTFGIFVSISNDNENWSDWKKYIEGDYSGRYYKLKLEVYITNKNINWSIDKFREVVQVQSKIIEDNITVAESGITINYKTDYNVEYINPPTKYSFIATDGVKFAVFDNVTAQEITFHLEDIGGVNIAGEGNLEIKGF
jgi:hypothetical protein